MQFFDVYIERNPVLTAVDCLQNTTRVRDVIVQENDALASLLLPSARYVLVLMRWFCGVVVDAGKRKGGCFGSVEKAGVVCVGVVRWSWMVVVVVGGVSEA